MDIGTVERLLDEVVTYLINANKPMGFWDNVVTYVLPIIGSIVLVGTAIAGVIKYCKEKNREYAEKMLTEVYAPLYMYIVKQEYLRKRDFPGVEEKNAPLFSVETVTRNMSEPKIENGKFEQKVNYDKKSVISLEEFYSVQKTVDFGLVPHNLLVLLSIYQLKENMEEDLTDEQIMVERAIKKEIIEGYLKYKRIMGEKKEDMQYINFEHDNITVNLMKD